MTECALVTVDVAAVHTGVLTVEILDTDTAQLEVNLQSTPVIVDIMVGGVGDTGSGTDIATVQTIAASSTLGLQQELLANNGQPAKTILAVGATNTGRVQGVSLGAGNVIEA